MRRVRIGMSILLGSVLLLTMTGCGDKSDTQSRAASTENAIQAAISAQDAGSSTSDAEGNSMSDLVDTIADNNNYQSDSTSMSDGVGSQTDTNTDSGNTGAVGSKTDGIDVDLTTLSSTMVYSEVYNMMAYPEDYIGKTIKMEGAYSYFEDETTGKQYYACIVKDATACCAQGIEFVPTDEFVFPDDYPQEGEEVTVIGTFSLYEENGFQYATLLDAKML